MTTMVANNVECMDGPCKGTLLAKAPLTVQPFGRLTIIVWKGKELYLYLLVGQNRAYWINIIKGMD